MKKTILAAVFLLLCQSFGAQAALFSATHIFRGKAPGINPGGQPDTTELITMIEFDTSGITGVGIEFTSMLSFTATASPIPPYDTIGNEPVCVGCTISDSDRDTHHRVRFVDGDYQGYEMFGPILSGSGRVTLLDAALDPTVFTISNGFKVSGTTPGDAQTIIFSGLNYQRNYGPVSYTLTPLNPIPIPGALGLFLTGIAGMALVRRFRRA